MITSFDGPIAGVLGGMGPLAGAAFMTRLTMLTDAAVDQDHIPAVLWNDPRVPDRTQARLHGGADPLPWMQNGIAKLEQAGAKIIAIPCNTAHLWYQELVASAHVPVLHIIESVADDLDRRGLAPGPIGLMGTPATLKLGLYQQHLEARGYQTLVPTEAEIAEFCVPAIELVKANRVAEAFEPAAACIARLQARGARAVALGCTELPLAVPHERRAALGIPLTDSIDALALAVIDWFRAQKTGAAGQTQV